MAPPRPRPRLVRLFGLLALARRASSHRLLHVPPHSLLACLLAAPLTSDERRPRRLDKSLDAINPNWQLGVARGHVLAHM